MNTNIERPIDSLRAFLGFLFQGDRNDISTRRIKIIIDKPQLMRIQEAIENEAKEAGLVIDSRTPEEKEMTHDYIRCSYPGSGIISFEVFPEEA